MVSKGYHYVKDDIFKFECDHKGKVTLKPKEVATFKIVKKHHETNKNSELENELASE